MVWDPVSDSGAISHRVYVSSYPVVNPLDPRTHNFMLKTTATKAVVTFQAEGKYAVGLRTKKSIDGEELYSEIYWSSENGMNTPDPFIVACYIKQSYYLGLWIFNDKMIWQVVPFYSPGFLRRLSTSLRCVIHID